MPVTSSGRPYRYEFDVIQNTTGNYGRLPHRIRYRFVYEDNEEVPSIWDRLMSLDVESIQTLCNTLQKFLVEQGNASV